MNWAERIVGVRNTRAFINANPVKVNLLRPRYERTPAGGVRKVHPPEVITEQTFRIVPMSGMVWDRSTTTPDEGRVADVTQQLIGLPDADVLKHDYFPHEGGFVQVIHISPVKGYRKEARITWFQSESELLS